MLDYTQQAGAPGGDIAQNLNKALLAGQPNLPGAVGSPLVYQALDPLLVNTAFQMPDLKLWPLLPKITVKSTVAQYAELAAYGQQPLGNIFIGEKDVPQDSDTKYFSRYDALKQVAVKGSVSFTMNDVGGIVEPLAQESITRTMDLLRGIEEMLWYGNSVLSPLQWDGFITKILTRSPDSNIYDMRGSPIKQEHVIRASGTVGSAPNFGKLTHLFLNTLCKGDIANGLIPEQRVLIGNGANNASTILGIDPTHIRTTSSLLELVDTPLLGDGGCPTNGVGGAANLVPATPIVSTQPTSAAPGPGQISKFVATEDVGGVSYVVTAANRYGVSAPVRVNPSAVVATQNGQVINFGITPGAGVLPEHLIVYRTKVNSATTALEAHRLILKVPNVDGNGVPKNGEITVTDANAKLPGTYDAIAFEMNPQYVRFLQVGPMTRIPMGIVETALSFMLRLVGTPQMRAPGKVFLFQNVGLAPNSPMAL